IQISSPAHCCAPAMDAAWGFLAARTTMRGPWPRNSGPCPSPASSVTERSGRWAAVRTCTGSRRASPSSFPATLRRHLGDSYLATLVRRAVDRVHDALNGESVGKGREGPPVTAVDPVDDSLGQLDEGAKTRVLEPSLVLCLRRNLLRAAVGAAVEFGPFQGQHALAPEDFGSPIAAGCAHAQVDAAKDAAFESKRNAGRVVRGHPLVSAAVVTRPLRPDRAQVRSHRRDRAEPKANRVDVVGPDRLEESTAPRAVEKPTVGLVDSGMDQVRDADEDRFADGSRCQQ